MASIDISFAEVLPKVRAIAGGPWRPSASSEATGSAMLSENRFEWSQTDYGALCAGVPLVPIHTTLTSAQVGYILADSGAKAVFRLQPGTAGEGPGGDAGSLSDPVKLVVFDDFLDEVPEGVLCGRISWSRGRAEAEEAVGGGRFGPRPFLRSPMTPRPSSIPPELPGTQRE